MDRTWNGKLYLGSHMPGSIRLCAMEAAAHVAGEVHSENPKCVSKHFWGFIPAWNDSFGTSDTLRTKWLADFIYRLPGTKARQRVEDRRNRMLANCAICELLPLYLECRRLVRRVIPAGLTNLLAILPKVTGPKSQRRCAELILAFLHGNNTEFALCGSRGAIGLGSESLVELMRAIRHNMLVGLSGHTCGDLLVKIKEGRRNNHLICRKTDQIISNLVDRLIKVTEPQEKSAVQCATVQSVA